MLPSPAHTPLEGPRHDIQRSGTRGLKTIIDQRVKVYDNNQRVKGWKAVVFVYVRGKYLHTLYQLTSDPIVTFAVESIPGGLREGNRIPWVN